jgi:antitoxin MazE
MLVHCSTSHGGVHMVKKLTKHGNSLALVLDRGVLDLLEINADTFLNIKTDGKCLIVTPAQTPARQKKFQAALAKVNRQYGPALKKLAE